MTLATKSTPKKKNYNKQALAKKLDNLAEKVSKKDIFVVSKPSNFYSVLNYKTHTSIITNIPNRRLADKLCNKANSKSFKIHHLQKVYALLDDYHRYFTDTLYFQHTISESNDEVTVESAKHRLDLTNGRMQVVLSKLMNT